jgi:hypothetical protein
MILLEVYQAVMQITIIVLFVLKDYTDIILTRKTES